MAVKKKVKRSLRQKYSLEALMVQVTPIASQILKGSLLAMDPSCISSSSLPGWALYRRGKLVDSGVISGISPYSDLSQRLRFIGEYIREHFEDPDVLIIELIQAMRNGRKNESLLKAVGCIMGNFSCDHVLEIHPLVWQKYLTQTHGNDYESAKHYRESLKSDKRDAEEMGRAVIQMARDLTET